MKNEFLKVHPDLREMAKKSPKIFLNNTTVWLMDQMLALIPALKPPKDILIENIVIRSQDDRANVRLRIYKPISIVTPAPMLLWLHGGGYVMGKPEMDDFICLEFVRTLGIAVVSVGYRHAPQHPFPAGLEDAHSAIQWVKSHASELGVDMNRLAIGGESAGAGLAAALVQLVHDQQEIKPVFQLLIYPMLDDRTAARTDIDDSNAVMWTQKNNRFGWDAYLGQKYGAENLPAYAAPARRADLSGLPPAWIGVGTLDIFHDEDVAYAQTLKDCAVACEVLVVSGAFHGFDRFNTELSIVQDFKKSQMAALKKYLLL